jgi:biotin carboxyl carrier protein
VTVERRKAATGSDGDGAATAGVAAAGALDALRTDDERATDHAAIDRLADELVPALIAKLSSSGLAEIEVGEGDWTVRVRRPSDTVRDGRRAVERGSRGQAGHAGAGHPGGGFEGHRGPRDVRPGSGGVASANGSTPGGAGSDAAAGHPRVVDRSDAHRVVATSPAVGTFQPRAEARTGARVRAGDRLGAVDLLGVPQEVVAPADGIVGETLAESGQAVEYGQELIVIELSGRVAPSGAGASSSDRLDA